MTTRNKPFSPIMPVATDPRRTTHLRKENPKCLCYSPRDAADQKRCSPQPSPFPHAQTASIRLQCLTMIILDTNIVSKLMCPNPISNVAD